MKRQHKLVSQKVVQFFVLLVLSLLIFSSFSFAASGKITVVVTGDTRVVTAAPGTTLTPNELLTIQQQINLNKANAGTYDVSNLGSTGTLSPVVQGLSTATASSQPPAVVATPGQALSAWAGSQIVQKAQTQKGTDAKVEVTDGGTTSASISSYVISTTVGKDTVDVQTRGVLLNGNFYQVNPSTGKIENIYSGVTSVGGKLSGGSTSAVVPTDLQQAFASAGTGAKLIIEGNTVTATDSRGNRYYFNDNEKFSTVYPKASQSKDGELTQPLYYKSVDGYAITPPKTADGSYVLSGPNGQITSFKQADGSKALDLLPLASTVVPIYQQYGMIGQISDNKKNAQLFDIVSKGNGQITLGDSSSDRSVVLNVNTDTTGVITSSIVTNMGSYVAGSTDKSGYSITSTVNPITKIETVTTIQKDATGADITTASTWSADGKTMLSTQYALPTGGTGTYSRVSTDPSKYAGYFAGDSKSGMYVAPNGNVYDGVDLNKLQTDSNYKLPEPIPNVQGGPGGIKVNSKALSKDQSPTAEADAKKYAEDKNKELDTVLEEIADTKYTKSLSKYEQQITQLSQTYGVSHGWAEAKLVLDSMSKDTTGWSGYTSLFAGNKAIQEWKLAIDKAFKPFTSAGWVDAICSKKFKQPPQQSAFVKIPGGSISPAATVAAECTPVIDSLSGNTTRMYKFTVFVSNPQSTDAYAPAMAFNVHLSGSQDIDLLTQKQTLQRGESFVLDKDKQPVLSTELYDKICIKFDEPPEFFKSSEVCNKIVCRDDLSNSSYQSLATSSDIYVTVQQQQKTKGQVAVDSQTNATTLLNPSI